MTKERSAEDIKEVAMRFAKSLSSSFSSMSDPDGAPVKEDTLFNFITGNGIASDSNASIDELRKACWQQYNRSPFVQTAVNDTAGYLAGVGFEISSIDSRVNTILQNTIEDFRNKLYSKWKPFLRHRAIEGEHHLLFTCHEDGESFIEVDYVSPASIEGRSNKGESDGIIYHPTKTLMPLVYNIKQKDNEYVQIPSINIAYMPSLLAVAAKEEGYDSKKIKSSYAKDKSMFAKVGGFRRFIVSWDGSILARRNTSHLRTVIVWQNLYTLLKMVEIDHKRAMASFAWVMQPKDMEAWELWTSLTEDQKKQTGLIGPKPPGSTLIPPPGFDIKAVTPQLPKLEGQDTDIFEHIVAGLNFPTDVVTGTSKGTFASVKESRGPWGDRMNDQQDDFRKYLVYEFGKALIFLHRSLYGLPEVIKAKKAVDFDDKKNPIFKKVPLGINELISVSFPVFGSGDFEGTVKALCGSKHTGLNNGLGISKEAIAGKLGMGNYRSERLKSATEDSVYPELQQIADAVTGQSNSDEEIA